MKRLFFVFLLALVIQSASFASDFSKYRGVWASNDAEAVVTDSVCIFFEKYSNRLESISQYSYTRHIQLYHLQRFGICG